MTSKIELQYILTDIYGLKAMPVSELEHFDLSAVNTWTGLPNKHTVNNYGRFDIMQFQARPNELYNLVICEDDFTANRRLFEAMRDEEKRDVKDYELVSQNKITPGYFLYRLIPYTVQGEPAWC